MRSSAAFLLVLAAACRTSPEHRVTTLTVDESWLKNTNLSLAVLDVATDENPVDPAFFQLNLAQALRELGYENAKSLARGRIRRPWKTREAGAFAKKLGHDAAVACALRKEEGTLSASLRVIDAKGIVRYEVRVELPAANASGEKVISSLLSTLERIL